MTIGMNLDFPSNTVSIGDRVVRLTPLEFELLRVLVENSPDLVAYDDLLTSVWGPHAASRKNYLKLYVYNLRSKLEDDPSRKPDPGLALGVSEFVKRGCCRAAPISMERLLATHRRPGADVRPGTYFLSRSGPLRDVIYEPSVLTCIGYPS